VINNNIIDYIEDNINEIEGDMNYSLKKIKQNYKQSGSSSRKPRQEISKSAQKCLNKTSLKVSIIFD
jgi:hypothetical protein